jgi:hypothetical protein
MTLEDFFQRLRAGEWDAPDAAGLPPVDDAVLKRYIARQLTGEESRAVSRLIVTNPSWRDRFTQMLAES